MSSTNITDLYNKLNELIAAGDEAAARAFLVEHLKEFPEDVRKKIVFEFFAEAVDAKIDADSNKARIQKQGMAALKDIGDAEEALKSKDKISNIRSSLGI